MNIEELSEFARKKGFFWTSSEIYGGFTGFYDYGVNGTLLKRKFEHIWRKYFLNLNDNFYEIEPSDIMPEKVFIASGHITNFVDPVAKCRKCGTQHRADHILEDFLKRNFEGITAEELTKLIKDNRIVCPKCKGELADVKPLVMMFPLAVGAEGDIKAYLRPETAQGAYVNFLRHFNILRSKLPLGLAVIGKAYRNEISPRNLTTRMREFTQAELQIFFDPNKLDEHERWNEVKNYKVILYPVSQRGKKTITLSCEEVVKKLKLPKFYVWHLAKVQQFYLEILKIPETKFRFKELSEDERAFYNKIHWDIELELESLGGFKEVGGVHYRGDYDLSGHEKISKESHKIFFDNKKFIAHVLELSFGVDRNIYALIELFYRKEKDRAVLGLPANLAPFQLAVFPLVNKGNLDKLAKDVYETLKKDFDAVYDDSGSIGKRYYREDERGTFFAITVDYDTLKTDDVTVRFRDTTKQIRVKIKELNKTLMQLVSSN
ncbi:MAG: glycine--tRNA ligase [Candidatus Aenigmarchaeota archaeon]|nr:glycine--tRNA ligase [Candidatus Aenigmarchaeota archaeon]